MPPPNPFGGDRRALLQQINKGRKLRKAVTDDRSAPPVGGSILSGNTSSAQYSLPTGPSFGPSSGLSASSKAVSQVAPQGGPAVNSNAIADLASALTLGKPSLRKTPAAPSAAPPRPPPPAQADTRAPPSAASHRLPAAAPSRPAPAPGIIPPGEARPAPSQSSPDPPLRASMSASVPAKSDAAPSAPHKKPPAPPTPPSAAQPVPPTLSAAAPRRSSIGESPRPPAAAPPRPPPAEAPPKRPVAAPPRPPAASPPRPPIATPSGGSFQTASTIPPGPSDEDAQTYGGASVPDSDGAEPAQTSRVASLGRNVISAMKGQVPHQPAKTEAQTEVGDKSPAYRRVESWSERKVDTETKPPVQRPPAPPLPLQPQLSAPSSRGPAPPPPTSEPPMSRHNRSESMNKAMDSSFAFTLRPRITLVDDSMFTFPSEHELPPVRRFTGLTKHYKSGRASSVPIDFEALS